MKKIIFDDKFGLTKAVLRGQKTMTRRKMTPQPSWVSADGHIYNDSKPPRLKVGEVVAVAQAYKDCVNEILVNWEHKTDIGTLVFKMSKGWNNKMVVRADLMPHQIRITGVRVERLQDITDEDCLNEGVFLGQFHTYSYVGRPRCPFNTPRDAFASLIDRISGKGTWASNPWVFVYEFELVK